MQKNRGDDVTGGEAVGASRPSAAGIGDDSRDRRKRRRGRQRRAQSLQATAPQTWAAGVSDWNPVAIRGMQLADVDVAPAISWLESGIRPPWSDVEACSPMLRALWQQFDSLSIIYGVLHRCFYDSAGEVVNHQLVLPSRDESALFGPHSCQHCRALKICKVCAACHASMRMVVTFAARFKVVH